MVAPAPVSRLQVLFGTLKAIVTERYGEPQARFEVETPTAIAGVHGTGFLATYDAAADETVVVGLYNRTWVRARTDPTASRQVELGPGAKTVVRRGQFPMRPFALPEQELRRLDAAVALRVAGTTPPREFGLRRGAGANAGDAKRPGRPGESAVSPQEQTVNQPVPRSSRAKPPPPPPPIGP